MRDLAGTRAKATNRQFKGLSGYCAADKEGARSWVDSTVHSGRTGAFGFVALAVGLDPYALRNQLIRRGLL